jgi:hypothetical protein
MLPNGRCCPRQDVRDGRCVPPPSTCPPGQIMQPNGTCQPTIQVLPRHHRVVPPIRVVPPRRIPRHVAPHWQRGNGTIRLPHGQPRVFRPVGSGRQLR